MTPPTTDRPRLALARAKDIGDIAPEWLCCPAAIKAIELEMGKLELTIDLNTIEPHEAQCLFCKKVTPAKRVRIVRINSGNHTGIVYAMTWIEMLDISEDPVLDSVPMT